MNENGKKQVSIIIPYKETEKELFPLLSSIRYQIGVYFHKVECILLGYGAYIEPEQKLLALFAPLKFRCLSLLGNYGCGIACQAGMNEATGDYLLFCDVGDILYSSSVLNVLITEAKNEPDIIFSQWMEEFLDPDTGLFAYKVHGAEAAGMHGALIRRQYLLDNDIRFEPDLPFYEDSNFLTRSKAITNNITLMPEITCVRPCKEKPSKYVGYVHV